MPTNHTSNYNLNQWEPTDQVRRVDFNADNAKIDSAIASVDAKAEALSASKAEASALEALAQKVTAQGTTLTNHAASITKLGNCAIQVQSYAGNGQNGSLTFKHRVLALFISGNYSQFTAISGSSYGLGQSGTSASAATVKWQGNTVTWSGDSNIAPLCYEFGQYYMAVALLDAAS